MNIMFMTKFPDGTPTDFVRKIIKSIYPHEYENRRSMVEMMVSGMVPPFIFPKRHSIRRSKRVRRGMQLSLRTWHGKPYRSKQAEFLNHICVSTQDVTIFRVHGKVRVWIGDNILDNETVEVLAINDGFDSADDFVKYFQKGFIGQIIHWTGLRY